MANNELKSLASIAKQRMRNATYNGKDKPAQNNSYFMKNISAMKRPTYQTEFVTISDKEDLAFLKKVYTLLNSNEDIYNPIGKLIDKSTFSNLSQIEQQQHVLYIAERYNDARNKYFEGKQTVN